VSILNALTIDVEDYFQVSGFEKHIERRQWDGYEIRVVANTQRILDLLDTHNVKATFFVLGWIADRFPDLVCEISDRGHEVGSHSYWHRLVYELTPEEFRQDLRRSRDALERAANAPVTAYRAPSFSIVEPCRWALDVLAEEGYRIDSSIFPICHDRYGIAGAPRQLHRLDTGAGPLWEFPPSVCRIAGVNVPVSGGGYFRLFPLLLTIACLKRVQRTTGQPLMFYLHPWEIDPEQPRLRVGSYLSRFRHYVNLATTERKLVALLRTFRFGRLCDVVHGLSARPETDMVCVS